ncbi:MAG TPA: DUF1365 domain-containing protein [Rhizomicrobium sp.]|jgi:DUF1365 family protein|nr:DUF1365 domain-containing protein [Rhizomicrobium sp.]
MSVSAIYEGIVMHRRVMPVHHKFRYRVFAMLIDLDELPALNRKLKFFGWNKGAFASFHDSDHGDGKDLRQWLDAQLGNAGIVADGPRRVLCYPRILGYVFNPLSVWFCYDRTNTLAAAIYEVHNTHGERHTYVLRSNEPQTREKNFYVSPFLSMDCRYKFHIKPPGENVAVGIAETECGQPVLQAVFSGSRKPLSDGTLASCLLRHPLMTVKIVAAIHFEALRLWLKRVPVHARHSGLSDDRRSFHAARQPH